MRGLLTGSEIIARQKEPPPSRALEQLAPLRYGGGNSPVRHQVVIAPEDLGKFAIWDREGLLAAGDSPADGQVYGRQNGIWVPVTGAGPSVAVQWDQSGVNWDDPSVLWDQVRQLSAQVAALQAQLQRPRKG